MQTLFTRMELAEREKQLEDEVKSKDKMIGELMARISKIQTIALGGETKE